MWTVNCGNNRTYIYLDSLEGQFAKSTGIPSLCSYDIIKYMVPATLGIDFENLLPFETTPVLCPTSWSFFIKKNKFILIIKSFIHLPQLISILDYFL